VARNPTNPNALEPALHTSSTSARTLLTDIELNAGTNTRGNPCSDNLCVKGHWQNSFQNLFTGPGVHIQHPPHENKKV
jgi:hypothetical protein